MGCAASKGAADSAPPAEVARAPKLFVQNLDSNGGPQRERSRPADGGFACFISHFKVEAATEARWLQERLEDVLGKRCFLDSDDLTDLSRLKDHVRESKCILLLQTRGVLARPWCLLELVTAIDLGIPIVGVAITSGIASYNFAVASDFMTHLDATLDAGTQEKLVALGVDIKEAAFKLSNTLPNIISVPLNMNESRNILAARVADIAGAMDKAVLPAVPSDKAAWLAARGNAPPPPAHGWAATGAASATNLFASAQQSTQMAAVPPEVPSLPAGAVARPDIIGALKASVLHADFGGPATAVTAPPKRAASGLFGGLFASTTTAAGMGGVGKSMMAAALVRDDEVRAAFQKICWVSVGQEPEVLALQQTLHRQLTKRPLPEVAQADELVALEELKGAANGLSILLVLDDVWAAAHATPLNFIDGAGGRSSVVVTTRMRSLLEGATEVQCGVLSLEASLELMLRAGGCDEQLLEKPPPAATEAVELCGRLPLALGIAGGIIEELGSTWQTELVPLLRDGLGGEADSVEQRVVTASLRVVPEAMRAGVEELFTLFAIFAEDAVVPDTAIDAVAPLMKAVGAAGAGAKQKRQVRQWLQQLIKANILRGSMDTGVTVHDLVRDCMIRRASAARDGGVRATQRDAMPRLLAAFDAGGSVAAYVSASLHWHVRQAQQPDMAIHADAPLMSVLTHESGDIRKQGAIGIGVSNLHAAADAADGAGENLEAAQLTWAVCAVRANGAGAEAKRAWASLKRLEEAGRGSSASRALESRLLMLLLGGAGGITHGSDEHSEVVARMNELAAIGATAVEETADGAAVPSKEVMDTEMGLGLNGFIASSGIEGNSGYPGPMTRELLMQSHSLLHECAGHFDKAAAAAPDVASKVQCWAYKDTFMFFCGRQHVLPEFSPTSYFGEGGLRLRTTLEQYQFDVVHPVSKQMGAGVDMVLYGPEPAALLLWWGNLKAVRAGLRLVLDSHKTIATRVQQGEVPAEAYGIETFVSSCLLTTALLAANELDMLREYMANSVFGAILDDKTMRGSMVSFYDGPFSTWKTDDGHVHSTFATFEHILVRGLKALLEDDTDASRAALQAWLPPAAELLRITEYECIWRMAAFGPQNPALLCARLHGERLGAWAVAVEIAEGVLRLEAFQPLVRTEALRLLGRAQAALGNTSEACTAAERAASEAASAKYVWYEMLALHDLLQWSAAGAREGVRSRLRAVVGRIDASTEELAGVIGLGALDPSRTGSC